MEVQTITWLLFAGLLLSTSMAHAQPAFGADTTAPITTASEEAPFQYQSAFTHYYSFNEQPVLPWRETNDTVGKIGGWRSYVREASQPYTNDKSIDLKSLPQVKPYAEPSVTNEPHTGHGSKP
ncbi:MAG: hypothetical protein HZC44_00995 [Geobacter sp.]|nr:hypothetical protein [Geobacter sp.]